MQFTVLLSFLVWLILFVINKFVFAFGPEVSLTSYKEVSLFAGLVLLISMFLSLIKNNSKLAKIFVYVVLVCSLLTVFVTNIVSVWIAIMVITLISFVYLLTYGRSFIGTTFSFPTILIAVFFVGFGSVLATPLIGEYVQQPLRINFLEVKPSLDTTKDVAFKVLVKDPFFGIGANRFEQAWTLYGRSDVIETPFWNTNFAYGYGMVPTFLATTGIVGILSFLFLIGSFGLVLFRLLSKIPKMKTQEFVISTINIIAFIFILISLVVGSAGATTLIFFILFAGLILRDANENKLLRVKTFSITEYPQFGFLYVIAIVGIILGVIYGIYRYSVVYTSGVYLNQAFIEQSKNGFNQSVLDKLNKAKGLYLSDEYARIYVEFLLSELIRTADSAQTGAVVDKETLSTTINNIYNHAIFAISYDRYSLQNNLLLAKVFAVFERIGVEEAKSLSDDLFKNLKQQFEQSPEVPFLQSQMFIMRGDKDSALKSIDEALKIKRNYVDAILLQAGIKSQLGQFEDSIATLEAGAIQNPQDPTIFNQLGLQYFAVGRYELAASAFFKVFQLAPQNSESLYFLAVSLYEAGDITNALLVVDELVKRYPQDESVISVAEQMRIGTYRTISEQVEDTEENIAEDVELNAEETPEEN